MRGCLSVIVGFAAFIGLSVLAGQLLGPAKCRDGWASAYIGRQGACSWHGGVDRSRNGLGMIFIVLGGFAGFMFYGTKFAERLDEPKRRPPNLPPSTRPTEPTGAKPDAAPLAPVEPAPPTPKPFVSPRPGAKACPKCGSAMRLRTARHGPRRGHRFWGCNRYPDCRGTIDVRRK